MNPRCIDQFLGDCLKLDTEHLTGDEKVAVWFGQHGIVQLITGTAIPLIIMIGILWIVRSAQRARGLQGANRLFTNAKIL
jgi:hypothetical protein